MHILLIVAAGKSSRFGGYPKAFCDLGHCMNVENTINHAKDYYDKIYLGVNEKVYEQFNGSVEGCSMFSIIMGQGDAHSLLKCLNHIAMCEEHVDRISVCWGDAAFTSNLPFKELLGNNLNSDVIVACAMDSNPYAWFDVDSTNRIIKTHFAKEDGLIDRGLHDQSLFDFDMDFAMKYLDEYREYLGIPYDNDEKDADKNEMKLLYSFEFLEKKGYEGACCFEITKDNVLSFNTKEELAVVNEKICRGLEVK